MKKTFIIFSLALLAAACNSNSSKNTSDTTTTTSNTVSSTTKSTTLVSDTAGLALIKKSDCLTCHKLDEKVIGPAYTDVAKKYTASDAVIDTLANKIIKGGSGNWGTIPMSAHPDLSLTDAKEMVKYILSLKNRKLIICHCGVRINRIVSIVDKHVYEIASSYLPAIQKK